MAGSQAFEWLCDTLERDTSLGRLEARGTVRIALKEAGLEARGVSAPDLAVAVEKVLPRELRQRGVADEGALCQRLARGLRSLDASAMPSSDTPDAIFRRLGGQI